jgi:hypothetical protein
VDIAAVDRRTRKLLGSVITETIKRGEEPENELTRGMGPTDHTDRVVLRVVPLTTSESALLVEVITDRGAWYASDGSTTATIYRVSLTGLVDVANWTSSHGKHVEGGSSDECELVLAPVGAKLPKKLELECHSTDEDWHNEDVDKRGMNDKYRTDVLTWNGARYEKP